MYIALCFSSKFIKAKPYIFPFGNKSIEEPIITTASTISKDSDI
jgi:hypothetical protein